jgi:hypothetical protein
MNSQYFYSPEDGCTAICLSPLQTADFSRISTYDLIDFFKYCKTVSRAQSPQLGLFFLTLYSTSATGESNGHLYRAFFNSCVIVFVKLNVDYVWRLCAIPIPRIAREALRTYLFLMKIAGTL